MVANRRAGLAALAILCAVAGVSGCNEVPMEPVRSALLAERNERSAQLTATKVDVLFVIDNTPSMDPFQTELQAKLPALIDEFERLNVDFHLGVVRVTDDVNQECQRFCQANADDPECIAWQQVRGSNFRACPPVEGRMQRAPGRLQGGLDAGCSRQIPGTEHCTEEVGPVLRYRDYLDAQTNLLDSQRLQLDFRCIAAVGTCGRSEERGLNWMLSALRPDRLAGPNEGFMRDDALLVVIFVANEDDCSHEYTPELFVRFQGGEFCHLADRYDELKPVSAFRLGLIEAKARFSTDPDVLREAESRVLVLGIIGWKEEGMEIRQPRNLQEPLPIVCSDVRPGPDGQPIRILSEPATRYFRLIESLTPPGSPPRWASICSEDYTPVLNTLGRLIGDALDVNCLQDVAQTCRTDFDCNPGARCIDPLSPGCGAPTAPQGSSDEATGYCSDFRVGLEVGEEEAGDPLRRIVYTPYEDSGDALTLCCRRVLEDLLPGAPVPEPCREYAEEGLPALGQYVVEFATRCPPGRLGFRFTRGNQPPEGSFFRANYPISISFD